MSPKRLVALIPVFLGAVTPLRAQTVDQIVDGTTAARGGADKLRALSTERLVGSISFYNGTPSPFLVEIQVPGHMRNEMQVQGKTIVQLTDGVTGWLVNPLTGPDSAQSLAQDMVKNMAAGADLEGPLFDYRRKGSKVELVGDADVEGRPAWKLKVVDQAGDSSYRYIDKESKLEVEWDGWVLNNGQPLGVRSFFKDWRMVGGVMVAFRIDSDTPGTDYVQQILIDSVDVNPTFDPARFQKP